MAYMLETYLYKYNITQNNRISSSITCKYDRLEMKEDLHTHISGIRMTLFID